MAQRITEEDVKLINEAYLVYGTYAEVARRLGFSSTTVSKYVRKDYTPDEVAATPQKDIVLRSAEEVANELKNWGAPITKLTNDEKSMMRPLKRGIKF